MRQERFWDNLTASTFCFSMNREFLENALHALAASEKREPDKEHAVELSIDLIPDGIGYECSSPKLSIIVSEKEQSKL